MSVPRDDDDDHTTDVTGMAPIVVNDEATARVAVAHHLVCVAGADLGRTFRLTTPTVMIGRGPVDVALHAKDVSRNHARIFRRDSRLVIEDLGSVNGTFVNGAELRKSSTTLHAGDRIQIGSTILVFAHHDELEERMRKLQRLESLASLAGGLAHDFNNALSVIVSNLEVLERKLPITPDTQIMINDMKTAATSASTLARRLLRLGRTSDPPVLEPVSLAPLVQRTVSMLRRQLPPTITINVEIPDDISLRASQEELHQVLVNLMLNARDAMPDGGNLRITARTRTFDSAQAVANLLPAKGEYVEMVVRDDGLGMDDATKGRAFEPFFTTKPPGEGTGLGLAMVHGIVRRHGGSIVMDSALGRGSTFTLWLPLS